MRLNELFENVEVSMNWKIRELEVDDIVTRFDEGELSSKAVFVFENGYDKFLEMSLSIENIGVVVAERKLTDKFPFAVVRNAREALAKCSGNLYCNEHRNLKVVMATGTNGKTSISHLSQQFLTRAGINSGVIGTLGARFSNHTWKNELTTPDPQNLHYILKEMKNKSAECVVMEASAHALYLKKLIGIRPFVGIISNCSRDHLDFFGTIENYYGAKKKLFSELNPIWQVYNSDDEVARKIAIGDNRISFGMNESSDIFVNNINHASGMSFEMSVFGNTFSAKTQLFGLFNLYNIMASVAVAVIMGITPTEIAETIPKLKSIEGRCQRVENDMGLNIIVDYAHTPDSVTNIINEARRVTRGRIITLFGCGGNRDGGKREIMGKIATSLSDLTVITTDNPRYESPIDIISQIERGARLCGGDYAIFEGRENATEFAIKSAKEGDTILVLGKGAEKYMEVEGEKYPYSDVAKIKEIIERIQGEK